MKRVLAIAHLAIRNAVRSRMVASLLALLLLALVGIPLTVQGDGTTEGHVRIVIGYTMGFAMLLLGLATLWSGALSVSDEIATHQVHLLASKPVARGEIWLGKWIGLMAVNTVLLAAAGAATYGLLRWSQRPAGTPDVRSVRDALTAHHAVRPLQPPLTAESIQNWQERVARGELEPGAPSATLLEAIRQELLLRAGRAGPGERVDWALQLPAGDGRAGPVVLRYRFSSSHFGMAPVTGLWLAGSPARPAVFQQAVSNVPSAFHELRLPGGLADAQGRLLLSFANTDARAAEVVFAPADGVTVLVPAGGFEANFARALLVLWARLAFLTALGVTAGTLFSTPVAVFMALAAVLILQLSGYVEQLSVQEVVVPWHDPASGGSTWLDAALRGVFRALHAVLAPLSGPSVLDLVSTGLRVETTVVLRALGFEVALYGGLLALAGLWVFNRRELALPSA